MKLVIDIPEEIYHVVMNTGTYGMYRFNSTEAIANGIPLDNIRAEIMLQTIEMCEARRVKDIK